MMDDIVALRERYGLTRKEFAALFAIPERTVQAWELGERKCPEYVFGMMEALLFMFDQEVPGDGVKIVLKAVAEENE